jgi:fatty-acyl-CoA synthase
MYDQHADAINVMTSESVTPRPPDRRESGLRTWIRALDSIKIVDDVPGATLVSLFDGLAEQHGDRIALIGEVETLTYHELAARSHRYARWAIGLGLTGSDVVCLLMRNRPEYVAIWLGLTRAGCVVALLNTNLVGDGLAHCIRAAGSGHVIVESALVPRMTAIEDQLPPATRTWRHGDDPGSAVGWPDIVPEMERYDGAPLADGERRAPAPDGRALLIFTSGTTGLPKAAVITHARIVEWSFWFAGLMDARPADRLYNCLPMYHSIGGIVAIGAMLVMGGSVLIRERFSASRFWDDVVDGGCTVFQYIGELCRYVLNTPPHPKERLHQLRLACGNGLQADVWEAFQHRFGIPRILEFYAATEGSVSLYNCEGKPGAIGRIPSFLAHRFPVALIRCDPLTGQPVRDENGLCVACKPDEIGEAVGRIGNRSSVRRFDGYTDTAASERKTLRDVLEKDDLWFRSGDLMRKDAAGFFYFVDRIGDTFRWKGENVSTAEVNSVVRSYPGVTDAIVYGISLPRHEGRAGMAAIVTDDRFDLDEFQSFLTARLPTYAQPLFIRIRAALDVTGTYKLVAGTLAREGYEEATEPVWFNDHVSGRFVACDEALVRSIGSGNRRL